MKVGDNARNWNIVLDLGYGWKRENIMMSLWTKYQGLGLFRWYESLKT